MGFDNATWRTLLKTSTVFVLAACGGGPLPEPTDWPVPAAEIGTTSYTLGDYAIIVDGVVFELPKEEEGVHPFTGELFWLSSELAVLAYESDHVLALAGRIDGSTIAGISGTPNGIAVDSASYETNYQIAKTNGTTVGSTLTLTIQFSDGSISGANGTSFIVDGTLDGASIVGTVELGVIADSVPSREVAELQGGLYGADEVAAVFRGEYVAGVLFGTRNP